MRLQSITVLTMSLIPNVACYLTKQSPRTLRIRSSATSFLRQPQQQQQQQQHYWYIRTTTTNTNNKRKQSMSTSSSSLSNRKSSMMISLKQILSQLQYNFEQNTNDEGYFPLLSEDNEKRFAAYMKSPTEKRSAVLLLLCSVDTIPCILFTRRAATLTNHAAQISFPGGHYEPETDTDDISTAVREAVEELIPRNGRNNFHEHLTIIGECTYIAALNGTPVRPVLAVYTKELLTNCSATTRDDEMPTEQQQQQQHESESSTDNNKKECYSVLATEFIGNPDEVDTIFTVSLQQLYDTEDKYRIPGSDQRFGIRYTPMFPSPYGEIWGLTAFILQPVLHKLLVPTFVLSSSSSSSKSSSSETDTTTTTVKESSL